MGLGDEGQSTGRGEDRRKGLESPFVRISVVGSDSDRDGGEEIRPGRKKQVGVRSCRPVLTYHPTFPCTCLDEWFDPRSS